MAPPNNTELAQRLMKLEELTRAADEERRQMHAEIQRLSRALLGDESSDDPSFMDRAMDVIIAWERSGWLLRSGKTLLLTLGAIGAAIIAIKEGLGQYLTKP